MASSGVKKVQQKIFGTGVDEGKDSQGDERPRSTTPQGSSTLVTVGSTGGGQGPGLTVVIPKPKASPAPPPRKNTSDPSPKVGERYAGGEEDADADVDADGEEYAREDVQEAGIPFRQRLAEKLGVEYKGAERYRLQQDDKREKHWKRWGPYLSDRQWVSPFSFIFKCADGTPN